MADGAAAGNESSCTVAAAPDAPAAQVEEQLMLLALPEPALALVVAMLRPARERRSFRAACRRARTLANWAVKTCQVTPQ